MFQLASNVIHTVLGAFHAVNITEIIILASACARCWLDPFSREKWLMQSPFTVHQSGCVNWPSVNKTFSLAL